MRRRPRFLSLIVRRFRRSRLALALVAVAAVASTRVVVLRAEHDRARWGTVVRTVIVAREVSAGSLLVSTDLAVRSMPLAAVPTGASTSVESLVGLRTTSALYVGDVVIAPRLVGHRSALAARLLPGQRAVGVPLGTTHPTLHPDDHVTLVALASDETSSSDRAGGPAVQRFAAIVLDIQDDTLTVAVPESDAVALATAAIRGPVAVILR